MKAARLHAYHEALRLDDVERAGRLRLVDLLELELLVVRVQARGLHAATPSFS